MTASHHARGGAALAVLNRMDAWEAQLVLNLRLWCEGAQGRALAQRDYSAALSPVEADQAWSIFDRLVVKVLATSARPLVRHEVGCNCVGSDECIFLHLVRTASDGHLNDAALIATLLSGPAHAEHIALLAGDVGSTMRRIHRTAANALPNDDRKVVHLH
ncbi:MAG: hypothetical protein AB3N09_02980 [Tateyamaria sp.]